MQPLCVLTRFLAEKLCPKRQTPGVDLRHQMKGLEHTFADGLLYKKVATSIISLVQEIGTHGVHHGCMKFIG